jgi:N-acetylglutamate synthase/N-acetylornithine aminotransferase
LNLPVGYRYAATYAGIRAVAKDDLALIVSAVPANAAAVFTQNRVQAAPVRLARQNLKSSKGQAGAILINAGNANCATHTGDRVASAVCRAVAKLLRLKPNQVLPASTGVIGVELDPKLITSALSTLASSLTADGFGRVSRAIMTTDTVPKTASEELRLRRGVMQSLARQIVRDGEGAKKLITIDVRGAKNDAAASGIARSIANSPLVKTAIAGSDANWGRIICAAGYAGVEFDPGKVDIEIHGVPVCRSGLAAPFSEPELKEKLNAPDCPIRFTIRGSGKGTATFWTCDFTKEYIDINGSYRT